MSYFLKLFFVGFFVLSSVVSATAATDGKKIIAATFEFRNARINHLARNAALLENLPFDGIVIASLKLLMLHWPIGSTRVWNSQDFTDEVAGLQKIASGKLKDNFLLTCWSPRKRVPFSDENQWERIAENTGILAEVAKDGKCAGLVFDVEDYNNSYQFYYRPEDAKTFKEAAKLARKRGAQLMRKIGKKFPEIKIIVYHLFCAISREMPSGDLPQTAENSGCLWGYFLNGIYDALPERAKIIEGNEIAYYFQNNRPDFSYAALDSVRIHQRFVLPENRKKFRAQGEFAFGIYMDSYAKKDGPFRKDTLDGSKLKRFRADLSEALRLTDEYVWLYCENLSWVKNWDAPAQKAIYASTRPEKKVYEELYPGLLEAIRLVKNPQRCGKKIFSEKKEKMKNLVPNPECLPNTRPEKVYSPPWLVEGGYLKGPALIPGWFFWPHWDAKDEKRFADTQHGYKDKFSLLGKSLKTGAFVTTMRVSEGNFYFVEAMMQGTGNAYLKIKWQDRQRKWLHPYTNLRDVCIFFDNVQKTDGWRQAQGVVETPAGAEYMILLLYMKQGAGQYNRFDRIGVYEIQPIFQEKSEKNILEKASVGTLISGLQEEIVRFKDAPLNVNTSLPETKRGYTLEKGKNGLIVHFQKYRKGNPASWPYVGVAGKTLKIRDWSPFKALIISVKNLSKDIAPTFTVVIRDQKGKLCTVPCKLHKGAFKELIIPLDEIAKKIDLKRVHLLQFAMPGCPYDISLEFIAASLVHKE